MVAVLDKQPALFPESLRVPVAQIRRTIAHDQVGSVVRQTPALPLILEIAQFAETELVVHETDAGLPCDLDQVVSPIGDTFSEKFLGQRYVLQNFAGLQLNLAQR